MGTWSTISLERPGKLGVKRCGKHAGSRRPSVLGGRSLDGDGSFISHISPACPSPLGLSQEISCGCRLGPGPTFYCQPHFASLSLLPHWPNTDVGAVGAEGRCWGIGGLAFGVREGGRMQISVFSLGQNSPQHP